MKNFPLSAQSNLSYNNYLQEIIQTQSFTIPTDNFPHYYVLKRTSNFRAAELEHDGLQVVKYLNHDHMIVRGSSSSIQKGNAKAGALHPVNNKWKADPDILNLHPEAVRDFSVRVGAHEDVVNRLNNFKDVKVNVLSEEIVVITTSARRLVDDILNFEEVLYAGIESFDPRVESRVLDLYLSPNTINKIHDDFPSLNGEGMTVSIKDQFLDVNDIDLQGRYKTSALNSNIVGSHATDMATIVAGAGNSFINGRGVAPAASMTSSDFENLLPDPAPNFSELDVWVQNHSYGTVIENFYGTMAEAYDEFALENSSVLHVFSSGNQGFETSTDGPYAGIAGFGNLTGNFKMAKNILTVGSVDTLGNVLSFSSRGPAYDGRVKPELVAYSTQGSSNSAAIVTGVGLLLQQAYKEIHGTVPSAVLLKALLINSANDVGLPGLDYTAGFGNVDAYRALENLQAGNFFSAEVAHGDAHSFPLNVPAGAKNLKVTLVWHDAPAMPGSAVALKNDVDLAVTNGDTWLPWVLDHAVDINKLTSPATRKKDNLNNIEQVTLENPSAGVYHIQLIGYDIPEGPQLCYVAYQWDLEERFTWTFPTSSDNFPYDGETGTYFYWRSTLSDNTGKLEYTIDDGLTWHLIAESVDLTLGKYRWNSVPNVTSVARARFVTSNGVFETESFSISRPVIPSVGFNCPDSVMLQWTNVQGIKSHQLFSMGEVFVEPFASVADTFLILEKNTAPLRFSIQPVVDGKPMLRSPLFDYNDLGTACYIISLVGEADPAQGVLLSLKLGTLYGVTNAEFQREQEGVFITIGESPPSSTDLHFLDIQPLQGPNRYRAVVHFANGESATSEVLEEYFLTTLPFVVFPNPVPSGGIVTIFSKVFDTQDVIFRLYKSDGSIAQANVLLSDREAITLSNVAPGFYLYSITSPEGVFNGRIVVK